MKAVNRICANLGLPVGDKFTQDWAYELPEIFRTEEWLEKYIHSYLEESYSEQEKNILMALMLDVSNDLISKGASHQRIDEVMRVLLLNQDKHCALIDYWYLDGEPLEDCFDLTVRIRDIFNMRSIR